MRPPSERPNNPRLALKSLSFAPRLTHQLRPCCTGQGLEIVHVLALIERDDLVHAANAELFPRRLGDHDEA